MRPHMCVWPAKQWLNILAWVLKRACATAIWSVIVCVRTWTLTRVLQYLVHLTRKCAHIRCCTDVCGAHRPWLICIIKKKSLYEDYVSLFVCFMKDRNAGSGLVLFRVSSLVYAQCHMWCHVCLSHMHRSVVIDVCTVSQVMSCLSVPHA